MLMGQRGRPAPVSVCLMNTLIYCVVNSIFFRSAVLSGGFHSIIGMTQRGQVK